MYSSVDGFGGALPGKRDVKAQRVATESSSPSDATADAAGTATAFRTLLALVGPERRLVILSVVLVPFMTVTSLAQPYLLKVAIDRHLTTGVLSGLAEVAMLFLGVVVVDYVIRTAQAYTIQVAGEVLLGRIRRAV